MIWAIDLDNGTSINDMGSDMNRPKADVYPPDEFMSTGNDTDLGSVFPSVTP